MPIIEVPEIQIPSPGDLAQVKEIKLTHDDYSALAAQYEFLRDSYTGNGGYETYKQGYHSDGTLVGQRPEKTYLQKYPREADAKWQRRLEGSYYPNWIRRIVGVYAGLLTRQEPSPDNYPDSVTDWQASVGWDNRRAQIFPWLLVYPTAYVLTDAPQQSADVVTAAQSGPADPYARLIHPDRALDWLYDEDGALLYFKYETDLDRLVSPLDGHECGKRYTYFTTDGWWYYDIWDDTSDNGEAPVTASGVWPPNIQGRVPVATYHSGLARDDKEDVSPIEYVARVMMRLYNVLSQKSSTEDGSCFPVLQVPVVNNDDLQKMNWSESTAMPIPADSARDLKFIGYDVGPIKHMTDEASRLTAQLKDLASIGFDSDQADTGIARAYSFLLTDVTLTQLQKAMISLEAEVMDLMARWLGEADGMPDDADPGFPEQFDLVVAREEIENANNMLLLEYGPVGEGVIKRKALDIYAPDRDPETERALEDEFDAMVEDKRAMDVAGAEAAKALLEAPDDEEPDMMPGANNVQAPDIESR